MVSPYPPSGVGAFAAVNLVIAFFSIALRCWARILSGGKKFRLDDWLAFAILPLTVAQCALIVHLMNHGVGEHVDDLDTSTISEDLRIFYAIQLLWDLSMVFIRFSALAFYSRIFLVGTNVNRSWKFLYYAVVLATAMWGFGSFLFNACFPCEPISAFWDLAISRAQCVDPFTAFEIGTVGDLVNDLMILLLPLPQVFNLRVKMAKRLLICLSFTLGYGVAFLSLGHLVTSMQASPSDTDNDITYFLVPHLYWCIGQVALSVFTICVPAMFQLLRHCKDSGPGALLRRRRRSTFIMTPSTRTLSTRDTHSKLWTPDWDNIYDEPFFGTYTVTVSGGHTRGLQPKQEHDPLPLQGIAVKQDVTIQETVYEL